LDGGHRATRNEHVPRRECVMSKIRVLLVDDEEDYVRTMASRMELRDVDSRVALSGEQALEMVAQDAPDVMVLDLRMPGIDGMAVLEQVKREHPNVEVVILTGHGSPREEDQARRLGAFEYLEKPADTGHLLGTIRAAWRKGLNVLRDSRDEFGRSMGAAAMAEAGVPEMAKGMLEQPLARRAASEPAPPPHPAGAPAEALKVLFVDDEEDFVRTMAERMEMRALGGNVALSGQEALDMLRDDVPDVMVLDLKMPGIGGMEVLRRVKRSHPLVQVIIMTGHGSDEDEAEARRLGAFEYLRKPVDIAQLVDAVRNAGRARRDGD
jgi:DNA-binding NtrC family response regulator